MADETTHCTNTPMSDNGSSKLAPIVGIYTRNVFDSLQDVRMDAESFVPTERGSVTTVKADVCSKGEEKGVGHTYSSK